MITSLKDLAILAEPLSSGRGEYRHRRPVFQGNQGFPMI
jgi:hypothetical protein